MSAIPARRKEDRTAGKVAAFFFRFFFVIGVAAFVSVVLLTATLLRAASYEPPSMPDNIVLNYTFRTALAETIDRPSLDQPLFRPPTTFHEIVHALQAAAADPRVKGLVARIDGPGYSLAQYQEMRDAIHAFRKGGKFAYVFADNFGGLSSGTGEYYLASAFEKIVLQPVGMVAVTGIASEVPFLRGFLDKIGVRADMTHVGRFKSAPDSLTETGMGAAQRQELKSLLGDFYDQIVAGIAGDRGLTPEVVRGLIDRAPYSDGQALENKLVDALGYGDTLTDEAREKAGADAEIVDLRRYSFQSATENLKTGMVGFVTRYARKQQSPSELRGQSKIGVVFGSGTIMGGPGRVQAGFAGAGAPVMLSGKIAAAIGTAVKDEDVAAIVVRIDSPGGEPAASEEIYRAILRARDKGKPVVVSMGGTAASGGYWVAAAADKIVAEPATITGSIGVFGGKIVLEDLWNKLGVSWEGVSFGANAGMWSSNAAFDPVTRQRLEGALDGIYDAFRERVAKGRNMTPEQVEAVAEGRVFSGRQAKENGLVDELGGLDLAVQIARDLAGIPPEASVPLERFPPQRSPIEMLLKSASDGGASLGFIGGLSGGVPVIPGTELLSLRPEAFILRWPGFAEVE